MEGEVKMTGGSAPRGRRSTHKSEGRPLDATMVKEKAWLEKHQKNP